MIDKSSILNNLKVLTETVETNYESYTPGQWARLKDSIALAWKSIERRAGDRRKHEIQ